MSETLFHGAETMEPTPEVQVQRLERALRCWRWLSAAGLALMVTAWVALPGSRVVEAQIPKVHRGDAEPRVRAEYKQTEVVYTQMAQSIGEWEAKGWETFQVVPIQTANLGVGGPMKVAIIYRRPTR